MSFSSSSDAPPEGSPSRGSPSKGSPSREGSSDGSLSGDSSSEENSSDENGNEGDSASCPVVGIGASAGGLQALQAFFEALSDDTGMAFVVIVHLGSEQESRLAELLQSKTEMPVTQVRERIAIEPNHVYVIPPGKRLGATQRELTISDFEEPRGRRAPVDYFFHSLAAREGRRVGVILSGGGSDGAAGINAIKKAGGFALVQAPEEAEHDSMPKSAIATGLVDFVLPAGEIAARLSALESFSSALPEDPSHLSGSQKERLHRALRHVHTEVGYDFSKYKRSTVLRRVKRRMQVRQIERLEDYLSLLQEEKEEVEALFSELLIGVSSFFRDSLSFEALKEQVVPELFAGKDAGDSVRVWVVGCSRGEEAYSVAMLLEEYLQEKRRSEESFSPAEAPKIQVFASDIDEEGIAKARKGRYPNSIEEDVSADRLERFFEEEDDHYRVVQHLRDRILFVPHNVLRDPPFSRVDLITCRNLLIYLQPEAQEQVFEVFHYALRGRGYLFLGEAETAKASDLFRGVDTEHCLYQAREHTGERSLLPSLVQGTSPGAPIAREAPQRDSATRHSGSSRQAALPGRSGERTRLAERHHREALEAMAPPSALVDEQYNVVHLSEGAGRYFHPPGGTLTSKITRLARPELQAELRWALFEAFQEGVQVASRPVEVSLEGPRRVQVAVRPTETENGEPHALVFFIESQAAERSSAESQAESASGQGVRQEGAEENAIAKKLEEELEHTRAQLRELEEEYESSREELMAQNEELRSMNEEYKAATEELETSKKELQSLNEELETVNRELEEKLREVAQAKSHLENFMAATDVGLLFLGLSMEIRYFTPQIQGYMNVREGDIGRPFEEITHQLKYERLGQDARTVLDTLEPVERKMQSSTGKWYLARLYPYRTAEDKIDGVVISFLEVTDLEKARRKVRELASQLTRAEQRERERLAHLLHDDLQQRLYGSWMKISSLQRELEGIGKGGSAKADKLAEQAWQAEEEIEEILRDLRQLSVGLSPPVLEREGLTAALEWLKSHMKETTGLEVRLTADGEYPMEKETRVLLFQVTRELLVNVAKHASVEEADVELRREGGELIIGVADQGKGFDADRLEELSPEEGFGLRAARERVRQFRGDLEIHAVPGEGTQVTIRMPLREGFAQSR